MNDYQFTGQVETILITGPVKFFCESLSALQMHRDNHQSAVLLIIINASLLAVRTRSSRSVSNNDRMIYDRIRDRTGIRNSERA